LADAGPFGLLREQRIAASGVRTVFTPHQPVQSAALFFGRQQQVQSIVESILTPGQHAVLFGDRGVGKSSLANVSSEVLFIQLVGGKYIPIRCDSASTFESISSRILEELGVPSGAVTTTETSTHEVSGGVGIPGLNLGGTGTRSASRSREEAQRSWSPSTVGAAMAQHEGLVVIDEFDALRHESDRHRIAELIKHLSDSGAKLKILVVGIAESCTDLMAGHPSVQRCLREVELGRMPQAEVRQLVAGNAEKVGLAFDRPVVDEIVRLSSGYPHFAHLLALKCAEDAVGNESAVVDAAVLDRAVILAAGDAEQTLRSSYADAVRSHSTDMYGTIVAAAADIDSVEFTAADLRDAVEARTGKPIGQGSLNNYFQRLVSDGEGSILRREAMGVYRFNDPRMKSYIRIVTRRPLLA
jgi:Cdc6-like AAA superfamily ATPase